MTFGVQPLNPGERGLRALAWWFVLAPGVTVTADAPGSQQRFNRFDANYWADDEVMRGPERLVAYAVDRALSPFESPPMPPAVRSAREPLIEKASKIHCGPDHVNVIGRPLPRAPEESREYGQGDFEVEALVDLVERTLAFVHVLAKS